MRHSHERQRGQSMTEFLVALAALLPLFLAVNYAGRYADVQQTAVQASRYATMQRTFLQPGLADARVADQMRARFFVHGVARNDGRLQTDDTAANADGRSATPLWRDVAGAPLLAGRRLDNDITLNYAATPLNAGAIARSMDLMTSSAGKSYGGASVSQIEVGMVNRMDLRTTNPARLSVAAATAAAGDGLGSSGSIDTRNAAATFVPTARIPAALSGFLSQAIGLIESSGPELGCIKPDVVPMHRLDRFVPAGGCL
jgi:hypothetical protein